MQQLGLQLERLCYEFPVREVEKLANECYYMSLRMLWQNDKINTDLTLRNKTVVLFGSISYEEG